MKLRYTAAWVGFTAAALVATSACSADTAKQTAETVDKAVGNADAVLAALGRATDRTESLGSAEIKATTDLGTGVPVVMDGTYSWGDGYAYDVEMDTKAANMQTLTDDESMRALFVDGAYYYDIDPQPSGPLQGKEWMKIDSSAIFGDKGAAALQGGGSQGGADPTAAMRTLKYAKDAENLGTETVNGREVTHYRGVVSKENFGKFKDTYTPEDEKTIANMFTGDVQETTIDIWVDGKDLPVRIRQELGAMTVTMDFAKFGATAKVTAPPAAQTGDVTEQMKEAAEQQG